MKKRLLSFIILLCTLLSSFPIAVNAAQTVVSDEGRLPFEDVNPSSWYGDAAVYCYVNGVMSGTSKYTFDPAGKLTRAQFVTVLYNIKDKGADAYYKLPFTDVNRAAWYYNALAWCYDNGIVSGTSPTSFSPNAYITRQEIARMMMMYMKYKGYTVSVDSDCLDKYTDKEYLLTLKGQYAPLYNTVNLIFKKVYVRISDVVDLGIHRQTAAAYLDQLVDEGLLSKEKVGRENIYKNIKLLALFENDSEVTV